MGVSVYLEKGMLTLLLSSSKNCLAALALS